MRNLWTKKIIVFDMAIDVDFIGKRRNTIQSDQTNWTVGIILGMYAQCTRAHSHALPIFSHMNQWFRFIHWPNLENHFPLPLCCCDCLWKGRYASNSHFIDIQKDRNKNQMNGGGVLHKYLRFHCISMNRYNWINGWPLKPILNRHCNRELSMRLLLGISRS